MMAVVSVWAPYAGQMEVEIENRWLAMEKADGGWWRLEVSSMRQGVDYLFRIDGGEALPDPRSAWQPFGVAGPSRWAEHELFAWSDRNWQARPLSSGVLYELHIGTFTPEGTFDSAIDRLEYLSELGVSHLEVMPVAEFPGSFGWGYDGVNLFAPHHWYGGPEGFKRFVDACHAHGLGVILDVVYNHLGPEGNFLSKFGPYFTDRYVTPWGQAVNFDGADSDEVRRFFCDNALMWLRDYHVDGLRFDAVHAYIDESAIHILEQLSDEVGELSAQTGRHLVLIAESDLNDPRVVSPRSIGGYGMDAQWSDDFHHALHTALTGERGGYYVDFQGLEDLAKALKGAYVNDGRYSNFRRRRHGRPVVGLSGHRFLGYIQNHDQIGNRAKGERIGQLVNLKREKIGSALVFTAPFIPMLFEGQEWGASTPFLYFVDFSDPELIKAVREGRRNEFSEFKWDPEQIPDPEDRRTFERSKLRWEELDQQPHDELLDWHRKLIRLRRSCPDLCDGRLDAVEVRYDQQREWLTMERKGITVAVNFSTQQQVIPLRQGRRYEILLSSEAENRVSGKSVQAAGESVAILGEE